MLIRPLGVLAMVALLALAMHAVADDWQQRSEYIVAPCVDHAPVIDGSLDDRAWQTIEPCRIRELNTAAPKGTNTQIRIAYDDTNLYIAFTCNDPTKVTALASGELFRPGPIWNFDLIEVFLDPDRTRQHYYHLAASPVADQYYDDETGRDGDATQDESWHEDWSFASHVDIDAKQWTMEVAVPFVSLGRGAPAPGDIWLANFARQRPSGWQTTPQLYLWSQLSRGFNDPMTFGALCFDHASPQVAALIETNTQAADRHTTWSDPNIETVGLREDGSVVLPTEQTIRPAGKSITFPGRPIDMAVSPDGQWLIATTSDRILLIDPRDGVKDSLSLPGGRANSLHGIVFAPDGRTVFVAGHRGQVECVHITDDGMLELGDMRQPAQSAVCGMTFSRDGEHAYIASSVANQLLITDDGMTTTVTQIPVGVAPYSVAIGPDDKVYVSNWGGRRPGADEPTASTAGTKIIIDPQTGLPASGTVTVLRGQGASLEVTRTIDVERFPCQLTLSPDRSRLYVSNANDDSISVIDTATDSVLQTISVKPDAGLPYGSQPVAQAVSLDGRTLYVVNATNNAIAVVRDSRVIGLIPAGWFPGAIALSDDGRQLYVANVRGFGAEGTPMRGGHHVGDFLGMINIVDVPDDAQLAQYTRLVAENNRQITGLMRLRPRQATDRLVPVPTHPGESSVFEHVIYIVRENHTYDQDLGDMPIGNGEPRLCTAPERLTPNAHALARRFVLLDNYHVPSVQSPSGHVWLSQAIASSYWEKAITAWPRYYSYSGKDALAFSSSGFLWDNVTDHGLSFRNYGEYVESKVTWADADRKDPVTFSDVWQDFQAGSNTITITAEPTLAALEPSTHPHYPGYDYLVTDVQRATIFIDEFKRYEREGGMPNMMWVWLPNNHTSGSRPGYPTAMAQIADNDMALGMIVDAISHSTYWPKTVIFCIEDDPWNGTDHVAGSRSLCYIASPYTKRGEVVSRLHTLTGLIKTIELILALPMMNQLDLMAEPMSDCFTDEADLTPYDHIPSNIPLDTLNPPLSQLQGDDLYWAERSLEMPLDEEPDAFPEQINLFKRLTWYVLMGPDVPFTYIDQDGRIVQDNRRE